MVSHLLSFIRCYDFRIHIRNWKQQPFAVYVQRKRQYNPSNLSPRIIFITQYHLHWVSKYQSRLGGGGGGGGGGMY